MSLEHGIREFVTATAQVTVHFPIDWNGRKYIRCSMCQFLSSNSRMCQLNKAPVHFPEKEIGPWCPLNIKEGESWESQS